MDVELTLKLKLKWKRLCWVWFGSELLPMVS